jgi:hypothetical protein
MLDVLWAYTIAGRVFRCDKYCRLAEVGDCLCRCWTLDAARFDVKRATLNNAASFRSVENWRILVNRASLLLSYELNQQRNNPINGCNCRGIAVRCVYCTMRTNDKVK